MTIDKLINKIKMTAIGVTLGTWAITPFALSVYQWANQPKPKEIVIVTDVNKDGIPDKIHLHYFKPLIGDGFLDYAEASVSQPDGAFKSDRWTRYEAKERLGINIIKCKE